MKILMILETTFPPDKRVENEIQSLINLGYEVHLACMKKEHQAESEIIDGLHVHRLKISPFIHKSSVGALNFPFYFNFWSRFIKKLVSEYRFDTVHLHDLPLIKPVIELRSIFGFKVILDLHENWPSLLSVSIHTKTFLGRLLCNIKDWRDYERKYITEADGVIVVVDEFRERLQSLVDDNLNIHVIMNTLNVLDYNESKVNTPTTESEKIIFIYTGGITYHRGIQYVIRAASGLKRKSNRFEVWIAGSGSYLDQLKKLSKELGVEASIRFFGWLPQDEIYRLQSQADVALIPHIKSEQTEAGMPHKMFQYMYSGIPIIASDCGPVERIIKETDSGVTYMYDNPEALAKIMENFIEDPMLLKRYGSGKEYVEKKYNWSVDEETLRKIYIEL